MQLVVPQRRPTFRQAASRSPSIYGGRWSKGRQGPYRDDNSRRQCNLSPGTRKDVTRSRTVRDSAARRDKQCAVCGGTDSVTLETSGWLSQGSRHFRNPTAETCPKTEEKRLIIRRVNREIGIESSDRELLLFFYKLIVRLSSTCDSFFRWFSNLQYYSLTCKP